jgi:ribosome biogenesis protein Nip4
MAQGNARVLCLQTQKEPEMMSVNVVDKFVRQFKSSLKLDESFLTEKDGRYFFLNEKLKKLIRREFYYAGVYLGKQKERTFFPSFELLALITENEANKTIVEQKTAWLFICGRDVFKQGIKKVLGSKRRGDYTLILNERGEGLGFGKILSDLDETKKGVAIKNVSDIGDFLRRETRKQSKTSQF